MTKLCRTSSRGLTLLEMLLALTITALVATAIAGMMGAVSTGTVNRRDLRAVTILANAASARLNSYIVPSRCVLSIGESDAALWFNDAREGGTVHATEIRWLQFDKDAGELGVHYVQFPDGWSQAACDLEDQEYSIGTDWAAVLATYEAKGWTASRTLVDELGSVTLLPGANQPLDCRMLCFELGFATEEAVIPMIAAAALSQHAVPVQ